MSNEVVNGKEEPIRDERFYRSNDWILYLVWLRGQGRNSDALRVCEEALQFNTDAKTRFHLSNSLKSQGLFNEAVAMYRQIIAEEADHSVAHVFLGETLIALGRYDEAISVLSIVPMICPEYSAAFDYMGTAYRKKGDLESAIANYRAGVAAAPYPKLVVTFGDALREAGQFAEAITVLSEVTVEYPNDPTTHMALGKAFRDTGRINEARQEWNQVLSLVAKYVKSTTYWKEEIRLDAEARRLLSETKAGFSK